MQRTTCGACGSGNLTIKLDLGESPLADEFVHTQAEAMDLPSYPLGLARCADCTLIQLTEVVDDHILWGGDYGFYSGSSSVVVTQQREYAEELMGKYPRLCGQGVVEIACNDGTMLANFAAAGYPTLGVDPARGPAAKAMEAGLRVWVEPFGTDVAERIMAEVDQVGLVVANNVVAHVADLHDFLTGVELILAPAGVAVVEFQYVADLILGNLIDHVYHEHRSFFSLTSVSNLLRAHGFEPLSVQETSPQGGSLRLTFGHHRPGTHPDHTINRLAHAERWLTEPTCLDGMQGRASRLRSRLRDLLNTEKRAGRKVAGYGASAKSTTLLNWCGIGPDLVGYMVDTTPTKHGRYTPGTGIPIVSPSADSRAPDVYALFVHNYLPEILRREAAFYERGGRWLVPIPHPVML